MAFPRRAVAWAPTHVHGAARCGKALGVPQVDRSTAALFVHGQIHGQKIPKGAFFNAMKGSAIYEQNPSLTCENVMFRYLVF